MKTQLQLHYEAHRQVANRNEARDLFRKQQQGPDAFTNEQIDASVKRFPALYWMKEFKKQRSSYNANLFD